MKKFLFVIPVIALLAAGCDATPQTAVNTSPQAKIPSQQNTADSAKVSSDTKTTNNNADSEVKPKLLDTSSWKVYKNATSNITFRYPANWYIDTTAKNDSGIKAKLYIKLVNTKDFPTNGNVEFEIWVVNKSDYELGGGEGITDRFKVINNPKDKSPIYIDTYEMITKGRMDSVYSYDRSDPKYKSFYAKLDAESIIIGNQIESIFDSIKGY